MYNPHYQRSSRPARVSALYALNGTYRPPTVLAYSARSTLRSSTLLFTSTSYPGFHTSNTLVDTGAQFSVISRRVVDKYGIPVISPSIAEPPVLGGVDSSMSIPRRGSVSLRVTVHFVQQPPQPAVSFTKQFEVMDAHEDIIVGMDCLPTLFPDNLLLRYGAQMANITNTPTQVVWHQQNPPQAKVAHIHTADCTYGDADTNERSCIAAITDGMDRSMGVSCDADKSESNNTSNVSSSYATPASTTTAIKVPNSTSSAS